jgi:hypothetical protein
MEEPLTKSFVRGYSPLANLSRQIVDITLLKRRPAWLVTIALANKLARICWALMSTGELYRTDSANAEARAATI